ncbi:uncharacterized protein UTRI_01741_B [Ustilago trichophora]|uniref:Histone chaperone domain-containing protein n=1 Tax=Ustilago trichophora TaxID=86804 RepID=A0A5C3E2Y2_9BASI|nr:uncharacterized protein UTRI_01741_B [Ustilago trichophora]
MNDTNNVTQPTSTEDAVDYQQPPSLDKGKGKAKAVEPEVEEEDEDDGEDDDDEEEDEDDFNIDDDELAELIEDEEELAEIDTSNIVWTGRRRNAPLDYSSEEALNKAGLNSAAAAAEQEEDDAEFHSDDMDDQ